MIDQPYEGATPEQLQHPMVRELLAVHDMFRNELAAMLSFVDDLIAGQQQPTESETTDRIYATRIRHLIQVGVQYNQMLHHHHHLESVMLFPALRDEAPEIDPVIVRLEAEHDEIAVLIDKFDESTRDLAAIKPSTLNTDMLRLAEALRSHLAYEETHVCPLLARFTRWPV